MTKNRADTRSWLLNKYGPTMTQQEVAEALSMKAETLRSKMWREAGQPWVKALQAARRQLTTRNRIYVTTGVADVIEGAYDAQGCIEGEGS